MSISWLPRRAPAPSQGQHTAGSNGCLGSFVAPYRAKRRRCTARLLDFLGGRGEVQTVEDPVARDLRSWLQSRGLPEPQKLTAADLGQSGRGLVAAQRIARGERVLAVPGELIVTPEVAARQSALAAAAASAGLPAWSVLAAWLAEARAAGPGHAWAPYLAALPQHPGTVLDWSQEEVEFLRGSSLHHTATDIRAAAAASCEELTPVVAAAEAAGAVLPGAASPAALRWAFGVLLSRLVRLSGGGGGGGEVEALVPWADFANHNCAATTFLAWDPEAAAVVLEADRAYRGGEEVVISYGQKTSGQLLLSYGFLPEPGSNPHDACLLQPHTLGGADAACPFKAAALETAGCEAREFPLRMGATPEALLAYAAFAAAPAASAAEAGQLARELLQGAGGSGAAAARPDLRAAAVAAVVGWCTEALSRYPSDLASDREELRSLAEQRRGSGGGCRGRRESVLEVKLHERQVLHRTAFLLQQELREARRRGRR